MTEVRGEKADWFKMTVAIPIRLQMNNQKFDRIQGRIWVNGAFHFVLLTVFLTGKW
jgi:hypothetical protein